VGVFSTLQLRKRAFGGRVGRWTIALLVCGLSAIAGAGQGEALDPGLPEYVPPAKLETAPLFVQVSDELAPLVERLGQDLKRWIPSLDLRPVTPQAVESLLREHAEVIALMIDPGLGKDAAEAAVLRRRWGDEPTQVDLGYDALVVVAAENDPVIERGLSLTELGSLFAKGPVGGEWRIRTWRQLDGPRIHRNVVQIRRVAPQSNSPIMAAFREEVLLDEEMDPDVTRLSDAGQVAFWVVSHEGALGVTARSAWGGQGALVPLARVEDPARVEPMVPIEPTAQAMRGLDYPLITPLSLYVRRYDGRLTPMVSEWVAYLLSRPGQAALADAGYVTLSAERALVQCRWLGVERNPDQSGATE
jgi:ABC-type phosphate transport system substrate-binding protein